MLRFLKRARSAQSETGFAKNGDTSIHFAVRGDGLPLLLHHAFGGSMEDWHSAGYVRALEQRHRVILFDARGHGLSSKPTDAASYQLPEMVGDIMAVLDAAGVEKADYWGYSIGGTIGLALLETHAGRLRRFVAGAAVAGPVAGGAVAEAMRAADARRAAAFRSGDVAAIASAAQMTPGLADRFVASNDLAALAALQEAAAAWPTRDLTDVRTPAMLYCGALDDVVERSRAAADQLSGAVFEVIADCDHLTAFLRANRALAITQRFLDGAASA